ncbi:hypothetical protein CKM354_001130100 [Cercospora kikuchii]|uniref:C2H2-type domain-containing protein n=1 Tax=Cercospora kikuchii TaxID=84275 RepID=A0A9P3CSQ3_9PEZI|nr:uncharacterized protein CKM354_001130100 [Cercospora kikuchii]GIZ48233.1 hypothetical protein CKM354_001130100 [Cercospora kikuchii]
MADTNFQQGTADDELSLDQGLMSSIFAPELLVNIDEQDSQYHRLLEKRPTTPHTTLTAGALEVSASDLHPVSGRSNTSVAHASSSIEPGYHGDESEAGDVRSEEETQLADRDSNPDDSDNSITYIDWQAFNDVFSNNLWDDVPLVPPPFSCLTHNCTYTASDKADLERHCRVMQHTSGTSAFMHDCLWQGCHRKGEYGFVRKDEMAIHMRKVHKTEIPKRSTDEESDHLSDTDTVAPSVISQGSTFSEATTLDGKVVSDALIQAFAREIFYTNELDVLFKLACQDPIAEYERLQRNTRRMIALYGKNLLRESKHKTETRAARLLQSRAISTRATISVMEFLSERHPIIMQRIKCSAEAKNEGVVPWLGNTDLHDENGEDSGLESPGEEEGDLVERAFPSLKAFLLKSYAYIELKSQLLSFAHGTYEKRIQKALGLKIVGIEGEKLGSIAVQAVATELSWVPPGKLSFRDQGHDANWLDCMKCFVEEHLAEKWRWWPLSPRKHPLQLNYLRLTWQLPSGKEQYVDVPQKVKDDIVAAMQTAPVFISHPASGNPSTPPSATASLTAAASGSQPVTTSGSAKSVTSNRATTDAFATPKPSTNGTVPPLVSVPKSRRVYLCIRDGDRYRFQCLKIEAVQSDQSDQQFFSDLKTEYLRARGWFRNWFSIWQYDHCQFYEFSKHALGTGEPAIISFPADSDNEYEFLPKPMAAIMRPPLGPIAEGEFRDFFYGKVQDINLTTRSWRLFRRQEILGPIPNTGAVSLLPKKVRKLHMRDGSRTPFWGLYAVERRSFIRVVSYFVLCNAPGMIFFFLWLFRLGYAGDLQNGAVPVQLSLSLTVGFVALIYGTREDKRPGGVR